MKRIVSLVLILATATATATEGPKAEPCEACATALSDCAEALDDQLAVNSEQRALISQLKTAGALKDAELAELHAPPFYKTTFFWGIVGYAAGSFLMYRTMKSDLFGNK